MYYEENYQWNIDITTMDAVSDFYMTSDSTSYPSQSQSIYKIRYNSNGQHVRMSYFLVSWTARPPCMANSSSFSNIF